MKKNECLHIPTLYEGKEAQIAWGSVNANSKYIVERIFNESFAQALSGYTWDNIDCTSKPWNLLDQVAMSWHQIETRTGKGLRWESLEYKQLDWSQLDTQSYDWQKLDSQDISFEIFNGPGTSLPFFGKGRTWLEFDENANAWSNLDTIGHTWVDSELVTLPGLSWGSIESRWLTMDDWERNNLTFQELESQSHADEYRGMTDSIPYGVSNAMYRIKSYDSKNGESDYLTTVQLPVVPVFYRNSAVIYPVTDKKRYIILLSAKEVKDLDKIRMNLRYNPYLLELTALTTGSQKSILKPGNYPDEYLKIYSCVPGKLWFKSTRQLGQNECFSGFIALIEFIAKGTGNAEVSLS